MSNAQTGQEDYGENESRTIETPVNEKEKDTGLTSIEGEEGDEPRAKRQKSTVWDHFDKLPLSQTNGQLRAKCKGDTIASEIEKCLLAWGIEKVFTITVDNASSNDNAVAKLKDVLSHWNGLDMHRSIEGIHNAIKYVRSSPGRLLKFKELDEKMKIYSKSLLTMDCLTRWNSTYIMLENAIKFSSIFKRMEKEDNDYTNYFVEKTLIGPPDASNWKDAKEFVVFLKVFYDITLQFSGSLYVTSNICFQHIADVFVILHTRANNPNFLVSDMAKRMEAKYEKYWGKLENLNPLLVIAMVLDPRYKMKFLKLAFNEMFPDSTQREAMTNRVTNALYCLYDFYSSGHETNTSESQNQSQTQASSEPAGLSQLQMAMLESRPLLQLFVAQNEVEVETDKYAKVEKYFQAELVDVLYPNFDILAWWKVNSSKYKILSLIARDVLAMPVSIVSSKSAFSMGGRVIDEFRSSLSSNMAEALICAQNWLSPSTSKVKGFDIDSFNDTDIEEQLTASISNLLES
ncbi:zinc finger BED domain-containing protein RICESLEEPER 2-like [Neltuma alba]|uniref:zinc finger BED domain-containing protein RICESLEEPER 2-like n=1 Tax=Neltuma alba TaxID=207710 RepID=UPI0010A43913|nr:zinc finger BED domain-containing protein RICESLEEPER 2-like [Prosopis alba]